MYSSPKSFQVRGNIFSAAEFLGKDFDANEFLKLAKLRVASKEALQVELKSVLDEIYRAVNGVLDKEYLEFVNLSQSIDNIGNQLQKLMVTSVERMEASEKIENVLGTIDSHNQQIELYEKKRKQAYFNKHYAKQLIFWNETFLVKEDQPTSLSGQDVLALGLRIETALLYKEHLLKPLKDKAVDSEESALAAYEKRAESILLEYKAHLSEQLLILLNSKSFDGKIVDQILDCMEDRERKKLLSTFVEHHVKPSFLEVANKPQPKMWMAVFKEITHLSSLKSINFLSDILYPTIESALDVPKATRNPTKFHQYATNLIAIFDDIEKHFGVSDTFQALLQPFYKQLRSQLSIYFKLKEQSALRSFDESSKSLQFNTSTNSFHSNVSRSLVEIITTMVFHPSVYIKPLVLDLTKLYITLLNNYRISCQNYLQNAFSYLLEPSTSKENDKSAMRMSSSYNTLKTLSQQSLTSLDNAIYLYQDGQRLHDHLMKCIKTFFTNAHIEGDVLLELDKITNKRLSLHAFISNIAILVVLSNIDLKSIKNIYQSQDKKTPQTILLDALKPIDTFFTTYSTIDDAFAQFLRRNMYRKVLTDYFCMARDTLLERAALFKILFERQKRKGVVIEEDVEAVAIREQIGKDVDSLLSGIRKHVPLEDEWIGETLSFMTSDTPPDEPPLFLKLYAEKEHSTQPMTALEKTHFQAPWTFV